MVTINAFHIENVKRVKAVAYQPEPRGLTVIGGRNGQGKTSVLDALAWALGGGRLAPSAPTRDGSLKPAEIDVTLSNGVRVTRKGKNAALTVTDEVGGRAGQTLLDAFVSEFAINLPKFLHANGREKANTMLAMLGVADELTALEAEEQRLYAQRHAYGQEVTRKAKYAEELPEFADAPEEPVSVSELLARHKAILGINAENQRLRQQAERCEARFNTALERVRALEAQLAEARDAAREADEAWQVARKSATELHDESTSAIETDIARIEEINAHVAANAEKARAVDEAGECRARYEQMTIDLEAVRAKRLALLTDANLPLPGLSVEDGELLYAGKAWDCMSGSEQLRVATSIVRRLQPNCGFVLVDKLEAFDLDTLREFAAWAKSENLQVIGTRVSTGEECSLIIEDGLPQGQSYADVAFAAPDNANTALDW